MSSKGQSDVREMPGLFLSVPWAHTRSYSLDGSIRDLCLPVRFQSQEILGLNGAFHSYRSDPGPEI